MGSENDISKSIRILDTVINLLDTSATQEDLRKIAKDAIAEIKGTIQDEGHVVTGNLLSSLGITDESTGSVSIGSTEKYSLALEYGRVEVIAKDKPLHWVDKHTGEDVFAMRSGPTQPTGVFERSILTSVPRSIEEIAKKKERQISNV